MGDIIFPEKIGIRAAEKDEYWLQDQIWENPSILTLGDLQPINREKKQSSGGKLDILLKDPRDNSMYEMSSAVWAAKLLQDLLAYVDVEIGILFQKPALFEAGVQQLRSSPIP